MTFVDMIIKNCERSGLGRTEFAQKCNLSLELIRYLEDPAAVEAELIEQCAEALQIKPAVFKGEEEPELSRTEKHAAALANARFPNLRKFFTSPEQCMQPEKALDLFSENKITLIERNLILYLSTNALYHFCETNTSHFNFDEYLFKLHNALFTKYESEVAKIAIPDEEKVDRIDTARNNIFACDSMENIAIRIVEPFAEEIEQKLASNDSDYTADLDLPMLWDIDDELMKVTIYGRDNVVKSVVKLLSVKEREKARSGEKSS